MELIEKLEMQNSVMVHIRRGDYVKNNYYDGICDENYYKNAIEIMKQKIENPMFFVFSDEIESSAAMGYGREKPISLK